jgi:hypothetical protein
MHGQPNIKNISPSFSTAEMSVHQNFKLQIVKKFNKEMSVHDVTHVAYYFLQLIFDQFLSATNI